MRKRGSGLARVLASESGPVPRNPGAARGTPVPGAHPSQVAVAPQLHRQLPIVVAVQRLPEGRLAGVARQREVEALLAAGPGDVRVLQPSQARVPFVVCCLQKQHVMAHGCRCGEVGSGGQG